MVTIDNIDELLESLTWEKLAFTGAPPSSRAYHTAVTFGPKILVHSVVLIVAYSLYCRFLEEWMAHDVTTIRIYLIQVSFE